MDEINVSEYLIVLLRRWRAILAIGILASVVAAVALLLLPRTFRGQAILIFPKADQSAASGLLSKLAGLGSGLDAGLSGSGGPGMYSEILKSRTLSEQVISDLGLDKLGLEAQNLQQGIDVSLDKDGGMTISCYAPTNWVEGGELPWLNRQCSGKNEGQKAAYLASEMTNAYIRRLKEFDKQHSLNTGRNNREFLEEEVTKNRQQLAGAEDSLRVFKEKHPTLPPPETSSQQVEQIISIRTKQIEAETELGEIKKSIDEAKNVINGHQAYLTAARVIQESPVVTQLKSQLAQAEVQRAEMLEDMTDTHPDVVGATQSIEKLQEKIAKEVARVTSSETLQINPVRQSLVQDLAGFEIRKSGVEARAEALDGVMKRVERELSDIAKDQMQYVRLLRDVKAFELVYTSLLTQLSQAKVTEAKEPDGFTVLDWAVPEKKHFKPKRTMTVAATFILGIMIGCCVALIQESRRPAKRQKQRASVV
jgi:uncharacterized protein involved in exopolysaccharide biosynthesis